MTKHRTLINVATLAANQAAPNWVVIDCRFDLADFTAGRRSYDQAHIPGAYYAHLNDDLSGPITATSGRHPLPDPQRAAELLAAWGINRESQVVAYDEGSGATAARLWWLIRWLTHEQIACAVLDGGLHAWRAANGSVDAGRVAIGSGQLDIDPDPAAWVDRQAVENRTVELVDARAAKRFRGEVEPIDPVAGHIPGALNMPFTENLVAGRFRSPDSLRERFSTALDDQSLQQTIHMCGSGVTACHNMLALAHAGLPPGRLYVGSWSEWIRGSPGSD